jgi:site-specific recombinase XerC
MPTAADSIRRDHVEADMKRLLDSCAGRDFRNRRDVAIVRLFLDTGWRLAGMAGLRYDPARRRPVRCRSARERRAGHREGTS